MTRVAYEPGRRPDGPCVFQRGARPLSAWLAELEAQRAEAEAYEQRRLRARWLVPALVLIPVAGLVVDLALGMPAWLCTRFAPVFVAAAALVLWTVRPRPLRRSLLLDVAARELAKLALALLILGGFATVVGALSRAAWLPLFGLGLTLALPILVLGAAPARRLAPLLSARLLAAWRDPPAWRAPLLDVLALARALEPLCAPRQAVTGFLDLSGVERPSKELRLPPRPDLGSHRLFRDEWARFDVELRDGSRLRLRCVETVDRRDASARLALAGAKPDTPLREPSPSRHALVISYWPARPRPTTERGQPPRGLARLRLGARRRLVELSLVERRLEPAAVADALRRLDPELRLARGWTTT